MSIPLRPVSELTAQPVFAVPLCVSGRPLPAMIRRGGLGPRCAAAGLVFLHVTSSLNAKRFIVFIVFRISVKVAHVLRQQSCSRAQHIVF